MHDQWVANYNYQVHWAHQERDDERRTPRDVLAWYTGRAVTPEELLRLFYRTRFGRKLDRLGYVRFRHWRVYGERGLARERAAVWLYGESLTVEYADELLAQYRVRYQPDKAHLRTVAEPRLFATPYQSPQLPLWELSDSEWLKVMRRPDYAPRAIRQETVPQPPLFTFEVGLGETAGRLTDVTDGIRATSCDAVHPCTTSLAVCRGVVASCRCS